MWNVYVLRSSRDKKFYVGITSNLERRLKEHASGKTRSLRLRRPLRLIHAERYPDRSTAFKREQFLKSGQGRKWLKDNLPPA